MRGAAPQKLRYPLDILHIQGLERPLKSSDLRGKDFMADLLWVVILLKLRVILLF